MHLRTHIIISTLGLFACTQAPEPAPSEPQIIFPNPDSFSSRDRNYGLTESPDGQIRAYVGQRGDKTDIYISRLTDTVWSEPSRLTFPARETVMSPHFSPFDGRFYFATDAQHPERFGREDLNVWSGILQEDNTLSDARPMPDDINTGGNEDSIAFDRNGHFVFTSDHTRGVGGFDIYYGKAPEPDQPWRFQAMPYNTRMADTQVAMLPDGSAVFYYAHMPDIYGMVDIFRLDRRGDGWSRPVNLGPDINSVGIDYGPGFSADLTRFYYSQNGQLMQVSLDKVLNITTEN